MSLSSWTACEPKETSTRTVLLAVILLLSDAAITATDLHHEGNSASSFAQLRLRGGGRSIEDLRVMEYPDPNNIIKIPGAATPVDMLD